MLMPPGSSGAFECLSSVWSKGTRWRRRVEVRGAYTDYKVPVKTEGVRGGTPSDSASPAGMEPALPYFSRTTLRVKAPSLVDIRTK
jgi:hypothetical protein